MYRSKATQKLNNIAYALIIGGALGNLFDRLWHGFVVDMIDFYVGDWHFATFNLADTAICIGAALIVLEGFLPSKEKKPHKHCRMALALIWPIMYCAPCRPGKRSATGQTGG